MVFAVWKRSAVTVRFCPGFRRKDAVGIPAWRAEFPDACDFQAKQINDCGCQFWVRPHGSCQLVSTDCLGFIWWSPFSDMCWKFGRCSKLKNTTDCDRLCASLHLWNCNFLSTAVRIHQLRRIILLRAQEQMAFKCAVHVYKIVYTGLHRHTSSTNYCQVTDVKGRQWLRSASSSSLIVSRTRLSIVMQWPGFSSRRCSCLEQPASTHHLLTPSDCLPIPS